MGGKVMKNLQLLLEKFERGLNPQQPEKSEIRAIVKGYGEISSIFAVEGLPGWVFKRLPLFTDEKVARRYSQNYLHYTGALKAAGLILPEDSVTIVNGNPVVLYIGQKEIFGENFCHKLIHTLPENDAIRMAENILGEIKKVWLYNRQMAPEIELSIDGQISNWAMNDDNLIFVDTSTPLFKVNGDEQLDPELLLNSTPGPLKWIIRKFFLQGVMERYYDLRLVYTDLLANLYKEQKPGLIGALLPLANEHLEEDMKEITRKEIDDYYKEDKFIWQLFLVLRKMDRWVINNILRKRYQFILPGKIKR